MNICTTSLSASGTTTLVITKGMAILQVSVKVSNSNLSAGTVQGNAIIVKDDGSKINSTAMALEAGDVITISSTIVQSPLEGITIICNVGTMMIVLSTQTVG